MSAYTVVNMKEVEDQAKNFGLSPQLEARFARVPIEAELIGITYQRLAPDLKLPWGHNHKTQEEIYVLISGGLRAKVGEDVVELTQWEPLRVHKYTLGSF